MHHKRLFFLLLYCMVLLTLRSFNVDGMADLASILACKGDRRQLCRDYLDGKISGKTRSCTGVSMLMREALGGKRPSLDTDS